jgi:hypothetical protein
MRIGSVTQHQGTQPSWLLYAAGRHGVTPIPAGDYEGNSLLGIAANAGQQVPFGKLRAGSRRACRPIRNDIDFAFSLGFPSLIFLVLILMGRQYGRTSKDSRLVFWRFAFLKL